MLKKVLIANRGEIACRVIASAKKLGLKTVAVYSDADKNALHVQYADEAYHIGPAPSKDSYLKADTIIDVAKQAGADCVHPGYGFLSENEDFAHKLHANGLVFIGPPASAIEAMGSKSRSKEIMAAANVPLVPGYYGKEQAPEFLAEEADKIGYPVLIKAAYGGGGKGMRIVEKPSDFLAALDGAKREALAGFGNDLVLIERYVSEPRHVEIQIFADQHGNCVYLGDRDCSLQRRHQKVIEEAPAPGLSTALRKEMGEAAVRCAKAINYVGAGTVEFLLCGDEFFFMEMNTRLQVEHPVTEMVTGLDLVALQLKVASGEVLGLTQDDISLVGHSFEARIYAEDPVNDFMPCAGNITALTTPIASEHVRIDTGVQVGSEISPFYDPMIAKLIVWDTDRQSALSRLSQSLEQFHIAGFSSNVEFLHTLANHPTFKAGAPSTHFIGDNLDALTAPVDADHRICLILASLVYLRSLAHPTNASPWQTLKGFRLNRSALVPIPFTEHTVLADCQAAHQDGQSYTLTLSDNDQVEARLFINQGQIDAHIDGVKYHANFVQNEHSITLMYGAATHHYELNNKHFVPEAKDADDSLSAPMNGTMVKHLVPVGEKVEKGQAVLVIEAMKMEYTLNAPVTGTLTEYCFAEGELVSHGDLLAIVDEEA